MIVSELIEKLMECDLDSYVSVAAWRDEPIGELYDYDTAVFQTSAGVIIAADVERNTVIHTYGDVKEL